MVCVPSSVLKLKNCDCRSIELANVLRFFSLRSEPCERRQFVATQLSDGNVMEPNARKVLANFEDDVKHAKVSGTCSHKLRLFIYMLAKQWKNRFDKIESCNTFIQRQTRDAPRISLELFSSRLMLKYKMQSEGVQQRTFS